MPRKKGQFFIISAVIVLLVLFNLGSDMNTEWKTDISNEQANDAKIVFRNLEDGINATIAVSNSSDDELAANLDSFTIAERNSLKGRYSVNIHYNISDSDVIANITLKSSELYAEKTVNLPR